MQCYPKLSPKREPMELSYEAEMLPGVRRLELPAPPGKEFRAPVLLAAPSMPPTHSVIQCMRPPPPPPPPPPPRLHKPPSFEEPSSSIPDLGKFSKIVPGCSIFNNFKLSATSL
ncbi:protein enabled homolog [Trichoplusia ni]|uniref:Protein enabled homolog n=1 Tax=Trichoplusia ni TaxID=7111 RepID=A0A7E5WXS3_TRINI|nr:protein enabled homolog [Trichoplusia ni]